MKLTHVALTVGLILAVMWAVNRVPVIGNIVK